MLASDALVGLPRPYPGPYMDAWVGLVRASALISATQIGVFDALPGTTSELAERTGCMTERLEVLLEALCAMHYLCLRRGRWRATRRARTSLVKRTAVMPLHATVGSLAASNLDVMRGLENVMRGREPPGLHDEFVEQSTWVGYQAAMAELNAIVADQVLNSMARPRRLLDVGGGPGTFAIAACRRWPDVEVVIADLPRAAEFGKARIAAAGLSERIRYVEGDARKVSLGDGYDAVTLLQVLHNVDRRTGVGLLHAARASMTTGGRITGLEMNGSATLIGTLASLTFCAWMGARAWTPDQLREMVSEAGFCDVRVEQPLRLMGSLLFHAHRGHDFPGR